MDINTKDAKSLLNIIDERIEFKFQKSNISKKYSGVVQTVSADGSSATVKLSAYNVTYSFLNKCGEVLNVGDSVYIEAINGNMSNGIITERFGVLPPIGGVLADEIDNVWQYIPVTISELVNDSGFLTESGVTTIVDGTVTTDYVNALGVTAAAIQIKNASDYVLLQAGGTTVKIGDFTVGRDATNSFIYKTKSMLTYVEAGIYIGTDGIGLGSGDALVMKSNGELIAKNAKITGEVNANSGKIGSSAYPQWIIGNESGRAYIYNNKPQLIHINSGVYLGTDGISLGAGEKFKVTNLGDLTASSATITGVVNANSGKIGSSAYTQWDIGNVNGRAYIYNNKPQLVHVNSGVYIGTDGISLGAGDTLKMLPDGSMKATKLSVESGSTIAGWNIDSNSIYKKINTTDSWGISTFMCTGSTGSISIGGSPALSGWVFGAGGKFGVTNLGRVYASDMILSAGCTIGVWGINGSGTLTVADEAAGTITGLKNQELFMARNSATMTVGEYSTGKLGIVMDSFNGSKQGMLQIADNTIMALTSSGSSGTGYLSGTWYLNGSILTASDETLKNSITALDSRYEALFDKLSPVKYKYNDGSSGRFHLGLGARELKQSLNDVGIDLSEFAAYCEIPDGTCAIRYSELIPLCIWEIQKLKSRLAELEKN